MKMSTSTLLPELSELIKDQFPSGSKINQSQLNKLAQDPLAQQKFLARLTKIMAMISNPRIRTGFFHAYLRIYAHKINKDGRHGSVIMEITKRCNQQCRHCYSRSQRNKSMKAGAIKQIIKLVRDHYKHIFITGGEPTLDKRVLSIARANPDIMFFMFTNGGPIDQAYARKLSAIGNLIPILSIDGNSQRRHDYFKGKGSWKNVMRAIQVLNAARMPWGYLSMVTNLNAREVLSKKFVKRMRQRGAILARYLEYIPVGMQAKPTLVPSAETYYLMEKRKQEIIENYEIYMQETAQKKCLGLVFFDVDGNIKCCPFFHYYKYNIARGSVDGLIKKTTLDWCRVKYCGECPVYSDQEGLKEQLLKEGWKPTISFNRENSITVQLAKVMSSNYRLFLKIKSDRGI
ncbi:MAG: radical SAM protein [Candidatus Omnitrophica bacterium]|nr:radical SAM protein [Candidatus Omnitrophota bacterium]